MPEMRLLQWMPEDLQWAIRQRTTIPDSQSHTRVSKSGVWTAFRRLCQSKKDVFHPNLTNGNKIRVPA